EGTSRDGPASADSVAQLRAQLETQQQELAAMRTQLAASAAQDTDAARAQIMRQQIREVLGEQDFRESLMPSMLQAGYDDGFFIKSSDDKFSMYINGYLQFRYTYYNTRAQNRYLSPREHRNDRSGFDVQRLRLIFSGNAYSEDLTYYVEMNADGPGGYDFTAMYAFIDYAFCDAFHVTAGMIPLVCTRGTWIDERGYHFIDRPMTDVVFSLGDGLGVQFWGMLFDETFEYYLQVVNSMTSPANRTITNDPAELDGNPAVTFRAIWHALGVDPDGWAFEGDIGHSPSPMLDVGFHYGFNDDQSDLNTTPIPFPIPRRPLGVGGFGLTNTNGLQINQFGLDAAFKYMGFYVAGDYTLRMVDPRRAGRRPFAPWWLLTRQGDTTVQHGAYVTMGYFLPIPGYEDKIEAVARAGGISTLANGRESTWEYGAGLNYYLEGPDAGHMTKLQMDVTKITEVPISDPYSSLANVNDDALVFRVQLQVAF
ncbi:MAG: hypothetical protein ACYSVY_27120, partial [Planctomycetota bacterium]